MKTCPVCDTDYPDQNTTCPTDGAVLILSHELTAGSLVRGKYRIVKKIGQGGMGVVYLAEHMLLGGHVALKFLLGDLGKDPKFIKRFRMEARAAHQLRHPNIVEVIDLDQSEDGSLFIAMEFVEGQSLRAALDEASSGFSVPRALDLMRGIASGLAAAHAHGTVHRDVKPENILLKRSADGREQPKVLDFGIVAMADSVTRVSLTKGLMLTPGYAAPEQWLEMPSTEMDGRTDLYALGCVFYEMLTGRTPFHAHNTSGWMKQHLEETPEAPSLLRPELANWTGLDGLTMRLLAKNREDRPQDAEVMSLLDSIQFGSSREQVSYGGEQAAAGREPAAPSGEQLASGREHMGTIVEREWKTPETIVDGGWRVQEPAPEPYPPAIQEPYPQPVITSPEPKSGKFPGWAWGVFIVLALAAGFAADKLLAPHPQPQQAQTQDAQSTSQMGASANPANLATQAAAAVSTGSAKPTPGEPASSQGEIPAPAENAKPTVHAPSFKDIEQQAISLYNQKHYSEANSLLEQVCAGGSAEACKDLGNLYFNGNGVAMDRPRAAVFYQKACSAAPPMGCNSLGVIYHNGDGVTKDDTRAAALYSTACSGGDALGCSNLGNSYLNGRGVAKDYSRAAALYQKACNAGNAAACSNLGSCYQYGSGVEKNPDMARQLLSKGCGMGNQWGCDRLKEMK